ncbi:MAG: ABC transporter ATP-binding protein [Microthrixaceae bacterium]
MSLLSVASLRAGYGQVQVLDGIDLEVAAGEIVVVLGANGAGKTTTLRALSGMIPSKGSIRFDGADIVGRRPEDLVRVGIAHVPQGRGTFPELTVLENLRVGGFARAGSEVDTDIERWLAAFPRLAERRTQAAGSMSGGEQQMLAIARALMSRPRLLLLDEPSLGLAPLVTRDVFERIVEINTELGTTVLVVEQNANLALEVAARGYVLETGRIVATGTAEELRNDDVVRRAYLGV